VGVKLIATLSFRLFRAPINAQAPLTVHRHQKTNDATVHIMEGGCSTDFSLCAFLHGHPKSKPDGLKPVPLELRQLL
jgi:hypothetical protein